MTDLCLPKANWRHAEGRHALTAAADAAFQAFPKAVFADLCAGAAYAHSVITLELLAEEKQQ